MVRHPSCGPGAVDRIAVRVGRAPGSLTLVFGLEGSLDRLAIPPARPPVRREGLWRHTCFELFMRCGVETSYAEVNVSPSGEWAAYRFDSYRDGMRDLELARAPVVEVRRAERRLDVALRIAPIPEPWGRAEALRVGASAVVEDNDGGLAYWALAHPPGVPDFHHAAGFALELGLT